MNRILKCNKCGCRMTIDGEITEKRTVEVKGTHFTFSFSLVCPNGCKSKLTDISETALEEGGVFFETHEIPYSEDKE